jgi:putative peptidoglycan lipid II flippase
MDSSPPRAPEKVKTNVYGAFLVAAGILVSRLAGLIRMRILAHFLGAGDAGDAFYAALKIPNFLQNLLGEGVLSASFIPVYANLWARGKEEEASQLACAIFWLLALVVGAIVVLGISGAPYMIDLIAPGFAGEKKDLTILLVRIIFPATGLLVLSAWCLGILNSHHQFLLSYSAPVFWNGAIIAVLIFFRHEPSQNQIAVYAGWGLMLGSLLQLGIQLPSTLKLIPHITFALQTRLSATREVVKNFIPVVISRGVVQLSGYIDSMLASYLPAGAVSVLGYAQAIYMLPISLFGMSVSAAELPTMSKSFGTENFTEILRNRINSAGRTVAFFIVPSVVGLLVLGDVIASLLFQSGHFDASTSRYVWTVLGGSGVGLLASTLGRLYSSAFYSLRDTKTPLRFSMIRVALTVTTGYLAGLWLPAALGIEASWGTAGLTLSAGVSGWVEFLLLKRALDRRVGPTGIPLKHMAKLWLAALISGGAGFAVKLVFPENHPALRGVAVLLVFGVFYFPLAALMGVEESRRWMGKVKARLFRR